MSVEFDCRELDKYASDLLKEAKERFPRETKAFMGRVGNKARTMARESYNTNTKKHTGNLIKGLDRGRPYVYGADEYSVRVRNTAKHAWVVEHGHAQHVHGKRIEKYVKGKGIMGGVYKDMEGEYEGMASDFVDKLIEEGKL